jgi:hypothetical protein
MSAVDWLPGGQLSHRLQGVLDADPDVLFVTLGANPALSKLLYLMGDDEAIACADSKAVRECATDWLDSLGVQGDLERLYATILEQTVKTRVVVLEYPGVVPSVLHGDMDILIALLNQRVEAAVRSVAQKHPGLGRRIKVVPAPAGFAEHSLPDLSSLLVAPLDTVWDPARGSNVHLWVLNNDGGIHPNKAGNRELAGQLDRRIWGELPDATISVDSSATIAGASAKLNAMLDPGGFDTAYRVEYGPAQGDYDHQTENVWVGRRPGAQQWSAVVDRLDPDTAYRYRFVVTQQVGDTVKITRSEPATFTTASTPTTRDAAVATTIDANGREDIGYAVEYGPTAAYGRTTARRYAGRPDGPTRIAEALTHLQPGTTYHWRFVITRQNGDQVSVRRTSDATVTTAP